MYLQDENYDEVDSNLIQIQNYGDDVVKLVGNALSQVENIMNVTGNRPI